MSQQFKPRVSALQPAQIIEGKESCYRTKMVDILHVQGTHWQCMNQLGDLSEVSEIPQFKCIYISNRILPFCTI